MKPTPCRYRLGSLDQWRDGLLLASQYIPGHGWHHAVADAAEGHVYDVMTYLAVFLAKESS